MAYKLPSIKNGYVRVMRKILLIVIGIVLSAALFACGTAEDKEVSLFHKEMIVGTDISYDDITDFYYTEENINFDAFYRRYRVYTEDGRHLFFHETRERKNQYGPCTEEDTVLTGTIELSDDRWLQFCDLVKGGKVRKREDPADSGDTGPWLYLYWKNDKSKYQQFSFGSYESEAKFKEYCVSLVSDKDPAASTSNALYTPEDYIANENMVFNYYEATVAAVGGDEYTEYVLYKYGDSGLILACYDKSGDSEESMHYCIVGSSVLDDCMKLVKKYKMSTWDNGSDLNGKKYVVRFIVDGKMIRVSSDDMPEYGEEAFGAIRQVLAAAWSDAGEH